MWAEVSSSAPHLLHKGLFISHTKRRCPQENYCYHFWIQTELVSTLAKNATKPNPCEIILLQTTRKENNWKTEETLERAAVTLEPERIERSNPWWWWWCFVCPPLLCKARRWAYLLQCKKYGVQQAVFQARQQTHRQPTPTFQQPTFNL
jgi:hypothetical protein